MKWDSGSLSEIDYDFCYHLLDYDKIEQNVVLTIQEKAKNTSTRVMTSK